jgi:hypothetical protein
MNLNVRLSNSNHGMLALRVKAIVTDHFFTSPRHVVDTFRLLDDYHSPVALTDSVLILL